MSSGEVMSVMSHGSGGWKVVLVSTILIFMQILMICGRGVSRRLKKTQLASDDYMLIVGTVRLTKFFARVQLY